MHFTVKLFATLKDRAGADQVEVAIDAPATVGALLTALGEAYPALAPSLPTALAAVNQEFAFAHEPIEPGDEIALFPPVSGGDTADDRWPEVLIITPEPVVVDDVLAAITRPETGGVCIFTGAVRGVTHAEDDTRATEHLVYEAYQPMAEQKLAQVAAEIRERYPTVQGLALVQRVGTLRVGETTVLVACASGHRGDGIFEAARYGIDRLKEIVPVWKQEVGPGGSHWVEGKFRPGSDDRRGTP